MCGCEQSQQRSPLFDHFVGASKQGWRYFEAERPRGLEIDHQLVRGRHLYRQLCWPVALEDAVDVGGRTTKNIRETRSICEQAAVLGKSLEVGANGRDIIAGCRRNDCC